MALKGPHSVRMEGLPTYVVAPKPETKDTDGPLFPEDTDSTSRDLHLPY
jgi:hypothetical protein